MKQTLLALVEIIFPMRDDARVVSKLTNHQLFELFRLHNDGGIISLLPFAEQRVRACVHEVKFHENQKAIKLLGAILHTYIESLSGEVIIVPIPLSDKRRKERGYNQVELIVKAGTKNTSASFETNILFKEKETVPQTTLSKTERLKNVADCFAIRNPQYSSKKISNQNIILLDDVTTTGATLKAAKAALLPLHPVSITLLAIAH